VFDYAATDPNLPGFTTRLQVMSADGTNPRQLTSWGLAPEHPTWSPDGQWILFNDAASKPGAEETIYTMHPDGTDRHVVYQGTAHTGGVKPQFSPDGSGVVDITNTPGVLENFPSWGTAPLE